MSASSIRTKRCRCAPIPSPPATGSTCRASACRAARRTITGSIQATVANTRRAIFCGAQAAGVAFGKGGGKNKFTWKEQLFDYDRELGVRTSWISGVKKSVYNAEDFGTITLTTYAAPAS